MLRKKSGSVEWMEFAQLSACPQVRHAVLLKHDEENNQAAAQKVLQYRELVSVYQYHGALVKEASLGDEERCDGIFTSEKGRALLIKHADCQAAIFYDPIKKILANVHCGWRGNVQNIYAETIDQMGSSARNLLVSISPSLGPCCAEFIHYKQEFPESFWEFQTRPTYFDLWEISRRQLMEKGVLAHHIEIAGMCTCCNSKDFYSYRRDKGSGRHATVASLIDVEGDHPA